MIYRLITYLNKLLFGSQTTRKDEKMDSKEKLCKLPNRSMKLPEITWNVPEIRQRINDLTQEIKALKRDIRASGHEITWAEQCELGALKHRATLFAALQAWRRNKLHFKQMNATEQLNWLESHLCLEDREELSKEPTTPITS